MLSVCAEITWAALSLIDKIASPDERKLYAVRVGLARMVPTVP